MCVCSFVCVLLGLFVDYCLSSFARLVGWLVVCVCLYVCVCVCACVCVCVLPFAVILLRYYHFWGPRCAFLALWDGVGLHCNTWGSISPPLVIIYHVFRTSWVLGARFVDNWNTIGYPWNPFWCLFGAPGADPGFLLQLF